MYYLDTYTLLQHIVVHKEYVLPPALTAKSSLRLCQMPPERTIAQTAQNRPIEEYQES